MISKDEIRAVLAQRGFEPDGLTQTHAESLRFLRCETIKLKKSERFPLVINPRHEGLWERLSAIPGARPSPDRISHNSNFVGFDRRLHTGEQSIAYGFDFGFDSASALEQFLDMLLPASDVEKFDAEAKAFLDGFLDADNPQFVYWLPRYIETLLTVRGSLQQGKPDAIFELIWKSYDNAVSNAGQGILGFDVADRLRVPLIQIIREVSQDGSAAQFDRLVERMKKWRRDGELPKIPRLLLARAFAAIHPDRFHTTVDVEKQDRVIPWFEHHTGFVAPQGNWATRAEALTAHLDRSGVFAGDQERRNMFPWYVFDQLRDETGRVPFRPGHTSRSARGEVETRAQRRTVEYRQNAIQDRLVQLLRDRYGDKAVATEHATGTGGRADALVQHNDGSRELFEIKPAATAREAVRQALGQLLEYAYRRGGLMPAGLHVVSDAPLDEVTREYLQSLETRFGLKLTYLQVELEADEADEADEAEDA
jgi:hypothetical protein